MAPDLIEHFGDSLIQHGKGSDRIYLMKLKDPDPSGIIEGLEGLAVENEYSKIFAKIPARAQEDFLEAGYEIEARVPKFFAGREDGLFLGKFLASWRREDDANSVTEEVLKASLEKAEEGGLNRPSGGIRLRAMTPADTPEMAELYRDVFESYPFPIFDPSYLEETMRSHIRYFGVEQNGSLVALASSETDPSQKNVEMTDFATCPSQRGQGLACMLLLHMEEAMRDEGFVTAYTIARAESFGMNIAFARCGYDFGGRLTNNTNIGGSLESMNVWYKSLSG